MTVYKSVSELIGGTPLVELTNYEKNNDLDAIIVGKVESFNPAGSVKDRVAKAMIDDAGQRRVHALGVHVLRPIGMLPRVRGRRKRDDAERYEQHPLEQELPYAPFRFVGFHRVTV